ncbi:MAG: hypothetical protein WC708_00240 [Lentisphaeria bacterium]|jgi:hypothetical protein
MDLRAMALRIASEKQTAKSGGECDLLHEVGRDADFGQDEASMATHTDLEMDDIENVDTRYKQ